MQRTAQRKEYHMPAKDTPGIWFILPNSYFDSQQTIDMLGMIPNMFDVNDPRDVQDQIRDNYIGGWNPMFGITIEPSDKMFALKYPDDPDLYPIGFTVVRNQTVLVYPFAWVAIVTEGKDTEVARLD